MIFPAPTLRDEMDPMESGRNWSVVLSPEESDVAVIANGVIRFGREAAAAGNAEPIACFCRLDGEIVAGACGRTEYARLFINWLWVAEALRGHGLGSEALGRLEQAARSRGVLDSLIETLSEDVARLYRRLGYVEVACIAGYVGPFSKHVLVKSLQAGYEASD